MIGRFYEDGDDDNLRLGMTDDALSSFSFLSCAGRPCVAMRSGS